MSASDLVPPESLFCLACRKVQPMEPGSVQPQETSWTTAKGVKMTRFNWVAKCSVCGKCVHQFAKRVIGQTPTTEPTPNPAEEKTADTVVEEQPKDN